ncbi:hypothetical protein QBC36DRAFT_103647 [Triangularia setosa]|uniref:DUF6594 domain-containing protein n=1 Tax=Triangularia setosa TaxID=2587417 RepID=A0AAN6VWM7_9PEZI|nr:hypothetical protein QBC36DRAFT_103647 [Podospora setosa]
MLDDRIRIISSMPAMNRNTWASPQQSDIEFDSVIAESQHQLPDTKGPDMTVITAPEDRLKDAIWDCKSSLFTVKKDLSSLFTRKSGVALQLRCLYTLKVRQLQTKLVEGALELRYSATTKSLDDLGNWKSNYKGCILHDYITAVRDLEYIHQLIETKSPVADHLQLHTSIPNDAKVLKSLLQSQLEKRMSTSAFGLVQRDSMSLGIWEGAATEPPSQSLHRTKRFLKKLLPGFMGGGLIIWPMIVMVLVLDNEKAKAGDPVCAADNHMLVISGFAVFIFAIFVSYHSRKPLEIFSATAAYAAVMVVFLGAALGA